MARNDIFDAIQEKLGTIDGLTVKFGPLAIEEPVKPVLAIAPQRDNPERIAKAVRMHTLTLSLLIQTDVFDELKFWEPLVEAAMDEDKKWGGLANDTIAQEVTWHPLDPAFPGQWIADHPYTVTY